MQAFIGHLVGLLLRRMDLKIKIFLLNVIMLSSINVYARIFMYVQDTYICCSVYEML
jgi:hypothetical protein